MRFSLLAVLWGLFSVTIGIPIIEAYGNKFFTSDGKQFLIRGVAYQLLPDDPLIDKAQCQRDVDLMKTIGVNTIRVYHVDPDANHDACMKVFADAGIYAMIDMDTFTTYILPNEPGWSQTQRDAYAKVMDAFHKYDNLLGLFVGNEIIAINTQSLAAPFIKSAARDLKAYRDSKGYRKIPVGYSAADIAELRPWLQDYLTCGGNPADNIDFYGINSYQWCDPSSYNTSGYANLQEEAKNFPVPIFFSETGCNQPGPRLFEDQAAIFGPDMVNDWSGSIIYEWIQEDNHYGLISYGPMVEPNNFIRSGTPTPVSPDWDNLSRQWAKITATGILKSDYDPNGVSTRQCPSSTGGGWLLNGNVPPPTLGAVLDSTTFLPVPSATPTSTLTSSASLSPSESDLVSSSTTVDVTPTPSETETENAVSNSREVAGLAGCLVSVMMMFTFWL